jgi:WD40 repeat protein
MRLEKTADLRPGAAALLTDASLAAADGGTEVWDTESESFSATLRCHDPNGELYNLTFTRDRVTLQFYSDDAIRTKVETWADTVATLA